MRSRLLALSLLAVTACGSGGSPKASSTPEATAMTKAEYVAAANAVCKDYNARIEAVAEPTNPDEFVTAMNSVVTLVEEGQTKLRALTPPADAQAEIETKFLAPGDQQAVLLRAALPKIEAASKAKDVATATMEFAKAFEDADKVIDESNTFAASFGLTECAG